MAGETIEFTPIDVHDASEHLRILELQLGVTNLFKQQEMLNRFLLAFEEAD